MNFRKSSLSLSHPGSRPLWHGTSLHRWLRLPRRHQRFPSEKKKTPQNRKLKSNKDLSEKSCFSLGEEGVWEDSTEKTESRPKNYGCSLQDKVRCIEWCLRANKICLILRNLSFIKYRFLGPASKLLNQNLWVLRRGTCTCSKCT